MQTPFIIAELSANHNQSLDIALKSVEAIAKTGADAIKLQTYKPSCLTLPYKNDYFKIRHGLWKDKYLWDLYEDAQMPWEWHEEIFSLAHKLGLTAFSTPFSIEGLEFLEKFNCPIYKIASFEVMHIQLIKEIAKTKKPVILSLGVANDDEIENALEILRDNKSVSLLYCISSYPAKINDAKLTNIKNIKEKWAKYNVEVGLSDHTLGISVPLVATLCGASMIEKHFILDKKIGGVDSEFSLDVNEFSLMVENVKNVCVLVDDFIINNKEMLDCSKSTIDINKVDSNINVKIKGREFARSLFISRDVKRDEVISYDNIACVRPSNGISPLFLDSIIGKKFNMDIQGGMPLLQSYIKN